jgi:hypothetical protein
MSAVRPAELNTIQGMLEFLGTRISGATHCDEIAELMAPLATDSSWVHLGGSGARQRIYRVSPELCVVFQFGHDDLLTAYGVFPGSELENAPQHTAPSIGQGLILVSPESGPESEGKS